MKIKMDFGFTLGVARIALVAMLAGCSKTGGDNSAETPEKAEPQAKAGVTMDAETQARIGLKMETPAAMQWQPQLHAVGQVVDPFALTAAVADYGTTQAAAVATASELERMQILAGQSNASPRALEAAQAAAAHDLLALQSARAKFTADWGTRLAAQTNLIEFATALQTGDMALVKLALPAGTFPQSLPAPAAVCFFNNATNVIAAEFADDLGIDPATQVQTLLFSVNKKLPPRIAVTAELRISGEPVSGVMVPASAVLRHEGNGWVYVQTATNQFVRTEIPLDRQTDDGWFVSGNLAATNSIVVTGAQTVLSAELGGGFTTGERD
jgi:hypothetical protein